MCLLLLRQLERGEDTQRAHLPSWSQWGNLRYSCNVAFAMAVRAAYCRDPDEARRCLAWSRGQLDYALGSAGRSFVVGVGSDAPCRPHHRAASVPSRQAQGWAFLHEPGPNPHCLTGALVGGPPSGDDSYVDDRNNYQCNEVAVDYNAGYTGALAGVLALMARLPAR